MAERKCSQVSPEYRQKWSLAPQNKTLTAAGGPVLFSLLVQSSHTENLTTFSQRSEIRAQSAFVDALVVRRPRANDRFHANWIPLPRDCYWPKPEVQHSTRFCLQRIHHPPRRIEPHLLKYLHKTRRRRHIHFRQIVADDVEPDDGEAIGF